MDPKNKTDRTPATSAPQNPAAGTLLDNNTEQGVLEQTRAEHGHVHGITHQVETASVSPSPADDEPPPVVGPLVRVRATRLGYFGDVRRRSGDVFSVPESAFSKSWMEKVAPTTPGRTTSGKEDLRRQHDEILGGKTVAGRKATGDANVLSR